MTTKAPTLPARFGRCIAACCLAAAACSLIGCAASNNTGPDAMKDADLHREGRLLFAGQVTPSQLRTLKADGLSGVVNCRTDREMDNLAFDQAALLEELGTDYIRIPLGGSDGYSPEDVDAFARALNAGVADGQSGDVLIHCGSGGRVRMLYTAYLIRYEGLTPTEALRRAEALGGGPSSLERLLGERLEYRLTGEPLPIEVEADQTG